MEVLIAAIKTDNRNASVLEELFRDESTLAAYVVHVIITDVDHVKSGVEQVLSYFLRCVKMRIAGGILKIRRQRCFLIDRRDIRGLDETLHVLIQIIKIISVVCLRSLINRLMNQVVAAAQYRDALSVD